MSRDDIIRMAREAGAKPGIENVADEAFLERFYALAVAKELRRLHEVNDDLLNAAKLFIKYDSYQYDGSGMLIAYNDAIEATKAAVKKSTKDTK